MATNPNRDNGIRIWRVASPATGAYGPRPEELPNEVLTAAEVYTDGELQRIAGAGFTAIWVGADFRSMVRTAVFPQFAPDAEKYLTALNAIVWRAARHQLQVYLCCCPPHALPVEAGFWTVNPQFTGQEETVRTADGRERTVRCLCTSMPQVKRYLHQWGQQLAEQVPDLGGIIIQTRSEYPTHCWSRRGRQTDDEGNLSVSRSTCPLCSQRQAPAVVAEIIRLIHDGVRDRSAMIEVVAWDCGWNSYEPEPYRELIAALPRHLLLMLDYDCGGRRKIVGRDRLADEYSLATAEPSNVFLDTLEAAAESGLRVLARLQIGTSHELATVPNLPLLPVLLTRAEVFRKLSLSGYMGCGVYGNMLSVNTMAFNRFLSAPDDETEMDADRVLALFAHEYFPKCSGSGVVAGWQKFTEAMTHYPFAASFLYYGPMNFSFILPFHPGPPEPEAAGASWREKLQSGDLTAALTTFQLDEVIAELEQLCRLWNEGEERLLTATELCHHLRAVAEINNAKVCGLSFRSALNFCRVCRLRQHWREDALDEYRNLVKHEIGILSHLLPILEQDDRFGYHPGVGARLYDLPQIKLQLAALLRQLV